MRSTSETLLEALKKTIDAWAPVQPWGVGYSGGRDSGVLLWALVQIAGPGAVVALHVDHGWRPEAERRAEAELVARVCSDRGVRLRTFGPPDQGPRTGTSAEASARAHRYRCFDAFVQDHPQSPVFLAHHADDQAETVLMRLLQGRSWQGLAGIPARRGPYLRPFLGVRSSFLARVADAEGVVFHTDSTNLEAAALRNFVRLQVFPLVEGRFPRAVEALGDLGLAWSQLAPRSEVDSAWALGPRGGRVGRDVWASWGPLVRQSQLQAVTQRVAPQRLSRRFLEAAARASGGRIEGAGWSLLFEGDQLVWETVVRPLVKEYFIEVETGRWYAVAGVVMCWNLGKGTWAVPALDPSRPWVCRSPFPGMRYASEDDPDWGKDLRRKRLGSLDVSRCLLVLQDLRVKAVFDLEDLKPVWLEKAGEKLNNDGIFVTLEKRSDYERR